MVRHARAGRLPLKRRAPAILTLPRARSNSQSNLRKSVTLPVPWPQAGIAPRQRVSPTGEIGIWAGPTYLGAKRNGRAKERLACLKIYQTACLVFWTA